MYKHRGGFPEGQSPIVLDTLSNAEYNIKYLKKKYKKKQKKQFTIYYRSTLMNIHLYTNVIKKVFCYLLYPTQSLDIVIIHLYHVEQGCPTIFCEISCWQSVTGSDCHWQWQWETVTVKCATRDWVLVLFSTVLSELVYIRPAVFISYTAMRVVCILFCSFCDHDMVTCSVVRVKSWSWSWSWMKKSWSWS